MDNERLNDAMNRSPPENVGWVGWSPTAADVVAATPQSRWPPGRNRKFCKSRRGCDEVVGRWLRTWHRHARLAVPPLPPAGSHAGGAAAYCLLDQIHDQPPSILHCSQLHAQDHGGLRCAARCLLANRQLVNRRPGLATEGVPAVGVGLCPQPSRLTQAGLCMMTSTQPMPLMPWGGRQGIGWSLPHMVVLGCGRVRQYRGALLESVTTPKA